METQLFDWQQVMSAKELEVKIGIEFKGPGFYLTGTDTLLVVPKVSVTSNSIWKASWPDDTLFDIYAINVPFGETIFSVIALAPTRYDERILGVPTIG